jgi:heme/copper-type cytochrome/quinol oxidase subunit 4
LTAYDHVTTLLSFVYALALTHILSRVAALILARERVAFSPLQAVMTLNAVIQVLISWLYLWDGRNAGPLSLSTIIVAFVYTIILYFVCASATPEATDHSVDLEEFYWRSRRVFYGFYLLSNIATIFALRSPTGEFPIAAELATVPFFAPCILALAVPARWAQWVSGVGLFVVSATWLLLFNSALR